MPFLLRKIPGLSWPEVPNGPVSQLWALFLELQRTQWLKPAYIIEGQLAQVRTLLTHCSAQVPYYQDLLRQAHIKPAAIRTLEDFRRIPVLQRRAYQEQFERFQARTLPAGMQKVNQELTSGTSGMPVEVWQTNLVHLWWLACHLRNWAWCGIDPRGTLAAIRYLGGARAAKQQVMNGLQLPCWNQHLEPLLETGPAHAMDLSQTPEKQLEWLMRIQPDYLLGYPPNLELLADLLAQQGERLHKLKVIQVLGDTLNPEAQARIESAFGAQVKNIYSCTEVGYIASPCAAGHGLHVHAENVLLEVLDENDRPSAPGETGRVVLTALHNYATPFIRYELHDGAAIGAEPCPCGRGLPLLTQVLGRNRPKLLLPDGRFKESRPLAVIIQNLDVCSQYQLIQRAADHLVVRVVPNRTWSDSSAARVVQGVQEFFEAPIRVEVHLEERIETTRAGKMRDIVSELS